MFQFIRRVSGSLFPRPDRPWRDDATSHAPTIGRKRRYSVTEQDEDDSPSTAKRTKNDPVKPDTESDSASEGENSKGDVVPPTPVEGQEVKQGTNGVKEVDLEDKDKVEDASSIRPEGVPLPDSPSGSPEPESVSPESVKLGAGEEAEDQEHADDEGFVASSAPEDDAEEGTGDRGTSEAEAASTDATAVGTAPVQEVIIATVESSLHDPPELKVKA